ncbi:MAG TPA: 3-oxo-tetronate kinase [Nakamurella sp.]|nr:3-oxo-tetronate kinase [Nakamurella sp.]
MWGIIADDVTGATDVAGRLVREGSATALHIGLPDAGWQPPAGTAVTVIALTTRSIEAERAVAQSLSAARLLSDLGARHIMLKVCSTFDSTDAGNIGPVLDALADEFGARRVLVCPASPENGRTVYRSRLFVHDQLLSESPLRDHPLNPMRESDLRIVLARQSRDRVGSVARPEVTAGPGSLLEAIRSADGVHVIADATDDADLDALAPAAAGEPVSCGATGLGAAIGRRLHEDRSAGAAPGVRLQDGPAAIIAGSCSAATRRQLAELAAATGATGFAVDPIALAAGDDVVGAAVDYAEAMLPDGVPVVYSTADPERVASVQRELGTGNAARLVETALAGIARELVDRGVRRLVVAGGETSGAVTGALGVRSARVGVELDPGVPWLATDTDPALAVLLKSGNFGGPDFFLRAVVAD